MIAVTLDVWTLLLGAVALYAAGVVTPVAVKAWHEAQVLFESKK